MPKVTIYTTPSCVYCRMTKDFFSKNGVQYEEKNVATDLAAREAMFEKSQQLGVPVIEIGDTIIIGFDQKGLESALGLDKKKESVGAVK
jgi:glutaredoxin-like YruB-family protein